MCSDHLTANVFNNVFMAKLLVDFDLLPKFGYSIFVNTGVQGDYLELLDDKELRLRIFENILDKKDFSRGALPEFLNLPPLYQGALNFLLNGRQNPVSEDGFLPSHDFVESFISSTSTPSCIRVKKGIDGSLKNRWWLHCALPHQRFALSVSVMPVNGLVMEAFAALGNVI